MMRIVSLHTCFAVAFVVSVLAATAPADAEAQSLKGSPAAVARAYNVARAEKVAFVKTAAEVQQLVKTGRLVKVQASRDVALHRVSFPFAVPAVVSFVKRLAAGYYKSCSEQLVVTSLTRPLSKQPKNASTRSVHPAGMAVDIRRSKNKRCREWLEDVLLDLEAEGVLEATRERRPPHYHVSVFPTKYLTYVSRIQKGSTAHAPAARGEPETYVVQSGDSLWSIARQFQTTIERLKALNSLGDERIDAGKQLLVPAPRRRSKASGTTANDNETDVGG